MALVFGKRLNVLVMILKLTNILSACLSLAVRPGSARYRALQSNRLLHQIYEIVALEVIFLLHHGDSFILFTPSVCWPLSCSIIWLFKEIEKLYYIWLVDVENLNGE